jgi:hypothetical protein
VLLRQNNGARDQLLDRDGIGSMGVGINWFRVVILRGFAGPKVFLKSILTVAGGCCLLSAKESSSSSYYYYYYYWGCIFCGLIFKQPSTSAIISNCLL